MRKTILIFTLSLSSWGISNHGYLEPVLELLPGWNHHLTILDILPTLNETYIPYPVPKTGQVEIFSSLDDGDLQMGLNWPEPRFEDNLDGTITDLLTGLVWLKDADCNGFVNWQSALNACASLADGLCGLTDGSAQGDWRLPNRFELASLVSLGHSSPNIPPGHPFDNFGNERYWSSSTIVYLTSRAWVVYFNGAFTGGDLKSTGSNRFLPVRGGPGQIASSRNFPSAVGKTGQNIIYAIGDDGDLQAGIEYPSSRFSDNGDGTITDHHTKLIWLKRGNCGNTMLWQAALDYCSNLADGQCGLTDASQPGDWRMPNKNELQTLIDLGQVGPCLPIGHPFTQVATATDYYWSSSTSYEIPGETHAYALALSGGNQSTQLKNSRPCCVLPVKGDPLSVDGFVPQATQFDLNRK